MALRILFHLLILTALHSGCLAQSSNKQHMHHNPLLCDPAEGICALPTDNKPTDDTAEVVATAKPVKIIYYTDPICSSCWGIEPQLRKLKLAYGSAIDIEYRMGGLLPDWSYNSGGISKPSDVAHHWDEVSVYYDMPIDGDVWLKDPLHSSYPPSIAFKAAQLQDPDKAIRFLRVIREMVFLQQKNITRWEHLAVAAKQVGLDAVQLKADVEGKAEALFREDLAAAKAQGVRGFPTLFFTDGAGNTAFVYGAKPYSAFEQALLKLHPEALNSPYDQSRQALFSRYPTLTAREYATLADLPRDEAEAQLDEWAKAGKLDKLITKNGALWILR